MMNILDKSRNILGSEVSVAADEIKTAVVWKGESDPSHTMIITATPIGEQHGRAFLRVSWVARGVRIEAEVDVGLGVSFPVDCEEVCVDVGQDNGSTGSTASKVGVALSFSTHIFRRALKTVLTRTRYVNGFAPNVTESVSVPSFARGSVRVSTGDTAKDNLFMSIGQRCIKSDDPLSVTTTFLDFRHCNESPVDVKFVFSLVLPLRSYEPVLSDSSQEGVIGKGIAWRSIQNGIPCRRCQECGYQTTLPFGYKVQELCLDDGEHKFKDFPNGESADDLDLVAELIKRPRRGP